MFSTYNLIENLERAKNMLPENTISSINKISTNRPDVAAFSVDGALTSADVENFYGLFDAIAASNAHIDMILIFKEYDGIDWHTLFNSDTATIRAEAFKKLRRFAVVGAPAWLDLALEFFKPFGKIDMRWFSTDDIDKAWQFIDAKSLD